MLWVFRFGGSGCGKWGMSGKRLGEIGDGVFLKGRSGDERGVGENLEC